MGQTPGQPSSIQLDPFTICSALGALLIAAGTLLAIDELIDGGDYAFWSALTDFARGLAVGTLVLLCAIRLGNATWAESLRQATPAIGAAIVVASVALAVWDIVDDVGESFWTPLNDLFWYIPITLGAAVYLSATRQPDRVLGSPSDWGRILGVVALVVGLLITIDDVSDARSDEVRVFLNSFGILAGFALFLLAVSLQPAGSVTQSQTGQTSPADLLNDARLPDWIVIGGVGILAAGILLGIDSLDAPSDGLWLALQEWGFFLGLGSMVLLAAGGQIAGYRAATQPYLRYALIAALVLMFVAGLKFAIDADSDQIWIFISQCIAFPGFTALGYAMFEASQQGTGAAR